ncbi:hypothetical protein QP185_09220 [Sphingomonas aerolata]|uniref:hypothetical protein n=1 Tax=Sphingomonas aerolata TaxID=185951 RepID=UPI002FE3B830
MLTDRIGTAGAGAEAGNVRVAGWGAAAPCARTATAGPASARPAAIRLCPIVMLV